MRTHSAKSPSENGSLHSGENPRGQLRSRIESGMLRNRNFVFFLGVSKCSKTQIRCQMWGSYNGLLSVPCRWHLQLMQGDLVNPKYFKLVWLIQ